MSCRGEPALGRELTSGRGRCAQEAACRPWRSAPREERTPGGAPGRGPSCALLAGRRPPVFLHQRLQLPAPPVEVSSTNFIWI